jgi:hypothetical protein
MKDRKMAKKTSATPTTATKAKTMAKPATAASAKPMAKDSKALAFVNPQAINAKEGRSVVERLCAESARVNSLEFELGRAQVSKSEAVSQMTMLFHNAAAIDKRINLALAVNGSKQEKSELNDRLRVVLGVYELTRNEDGTEQRTFAPWAGDMFPKPGEKKKDGSPTFDSRETNRSNFATQMRIAAQGAYTIISKGMKAEIDKATGSLAVTGKAVKEHFDQDRVLLNEKQKITVGNTEVKLKAKPSLSELARMGGAVLRDRSAGATPTVNPANNEQVAERLNKFREGVIDKLSAFNDDVANALDALATAIENALERNATANKDAA